MSEEIKTETTEPTVQKKVVELEQSKIDSLINDAYKRGATNGNKELGSQLAEAQKQIEALNGQIAQQQDDLAFEKVVSRYDVAEPKYLKIELDEARQNEDFDLDSFMNGFKEKQPTFFKGGNKPQPMRVDSSNNNQQAPDFTSKVKSAKSMAEIYALQKEI